MLSLITKAMTETVYNGCNKTWFLYGFSNETITVAGYELFNVSVSIVGLPLNTADKYHKFVYLNCGLFYYF